MPIAIPSILSTERLIRGFRFAANGLAIIGLSTCLFGAPAEAVDQQAHHMPAQVGRVWGAGPITVSLIDSVRREGPIRGIEAVRNTMGDVEQPFLAEQLRPAVYDAQRAQIIESDGFQLSRFVASAERR
jgi:hypothetical protein